MKITVINATEVKGITFKAKEIFLEQFKDAEITEFYLPKDCPAFCCGCKTCILKGEDKCKDFEYIQKIDKSIKEADLLVFPSPAYVFHTTGAMKAMLDHFAYRWMPHRPSKEIFTKRAVVITQCLGSGEKSAAKDIKDSLAWWGVSAVYSTSFKLMSDINWSKIPQKKQFKTGHTVDRSGFHALIEIRKLCKTLQKPPCGMSRTAFQVFFRVSLAGPGTDLAERKPSLRTGFHTVQPLEPVTERRYDSVRVH